ncbi:unnamed protein product [Parajaminaea phylloscopi]
MNLFHETAFGQTIRFLTAGRAFRHLEDRPGFQPPLCAPDEKRASTASTSKSPTQTPTPAPTVSWYGDEDPENPLNWPRAYKVAVTFTICIMTTAIYMGSSIFAPGIADFAQDRGTTNTVSALAIALFVWGYGLGPLVLSPITEVSFIGRNWPYIASLGIFFLLQIPTVLTDSVAGFLVLRFLAGVVGSPVLATGGATIGDIWGYTGAFANALGCWGYSAAAGPVVGPLVGGFATDAKGWRWTIWPLLWASGAVWLWIFVFLPETNGATILSRRAARLRRLTGDPRWVSEGDLHDRTLDPRQLAFETLVRPFELTLLEPVVFFNNLYIALVYGVLYCFFEAFPLVFQGHHGFNAGETGLAYLGILIAGALTLVGYCIFNNRFISRKYAEGSWKPEYRMLPVMLGGVALPVCLFWFGWTSFASVHWISPVLASSLFALSIYLLFQGILNYLAENYPRYMASVFASNDLMRAGVGGAFPLFSTAMFERLTVQGGCSLLGGIALLMLPLPFVLYWYGPRLRAASKRAQ